MWFFQEGSVLRPCDENLATQIEEGYIKLKPFRVPATVTTKVPSTTTSEDKDKDKDKPSRPPLQPTSPKDSPVETDIKSPVARSASPFRFPRSTTPNLSSSTTTTATVETAKKEMI